MDRKLSQLAHAGWVLLLTGLLAACGGGGGGGGGSSAVESPATTPPPTSTTGPSLSGRPAGTVAVGQSYSFAPSATHPAGAALSFTITNLPRWAEFDAASGRLSGTPASADVGTYSGITITVSDGRATASVGPFAITVSQVANGSATLSWSAPERNSDGSALTNLAGYQIRYGQSANALSQTVRLDNPSLNTYVVENLGPGTWFFAVTAVNAAGVSSSLSNTASKTIS
jgi:hypothetical protein